MRYNRNLRYANDVLPLDLFAHMRVYVCVYGPRGTYTPIATTQFIGGRRPKKVYYTYIRVYIYTTHTYFFRFLENNIHYSSFRMYVLYCIKYTVVRVHVSSINNSIRFLCK